MIQGREEGKNLMRNNKKIKTAITIIIIVALLAVGAGIAWGVISSQEEPEAEPQETQQEEAKEVASEHEVMSLTVPMPDGWEDAEYSSYGKIEVRQYRSDQAQAATQAQGSGEASGAIDGTSSQQVQGTGNDVEAIEATGTEEAQGAGNASETVTVEELSEEPMAEGDAADGDEAEIAALELGNGTGESVSLENGGADGIAATAEEVATGTDVATGTGAYAHQDIYQGAVTATMAESGYKVIQSIEDVQLGKTYSVIVPNEDMTAGTTIEIVMAEPIIAREASNENATVGAEDGTDDQGGEAQIAELEVTEPEGGEAAEAVDTESAEIMEEPIEGDTGEQAIDIEAVETVEADTPYSVITIKPVTYDVTERIVQNAEDDAIIAVSRQAEIVVIGTQAGAPEIVAEQVEVETMDGSQTGDDITAIDIEGQGTAEEVIGDGAAGSPAE